MENFNSYYVIFWPTKLVGKLIGPIKSMEEADQRIKLMKHNSIIKINYIILCNYDEYMQYKHWVLDI